MKQWRKVRLGDILTESKIESLSPNNKTRIRVLLNTKGIIKRPVMNEKKGATKYFSRKKGQFIYGKQNIHKGAFGVIPDNLDNFESTSDLPAFDVDKKCLPIWIDYYLKQGNFYLSLVNIARGVATKRVQTKELFELKIPLPTIKEQKIIVKKLKGIETEESDLKQEIIQQQILLKKLRQQILQEAIEGKLTQDWRENNPNVESASELLKRIQIEKQQLIKDKKIKVQKTLPIISEDEKPFKLPDSWIWCRLGDICNKITDGFHNTPKKINSGKIYISATHIRETGISWKNCLYVSQKDHEELYKKAYPKKGEILITNRGAGCATPVVIDISQEFSFQNAALIGFNQNMLSSNYIYFYILKMRDEIMKVFVNGGLQPMLSNIKLGYIHIPLPPIAEQKQIVKKVENLFSICDKLQTQITANQAHIEQLMQAVLKEAFTQSDTQAETRAETQANI
jgi:restriction endonuclease S subunit